ncbi:MAG: phosphoribosylaminoimidazolesuccinocarboxamide synthase [Clostridiales Family XIII bacterium]|jgi:phosphoribosylaminoimidazole-succinocarboxamide synthase|nr:phosphoribosylaminoimidazolesuccinocarboxamide synthase [Clostridiales Family XIII bacterium]
MAEKREQLYEGKAKKVYATDDPGLYIVSYKDDATAFNGEKKGTIADKGVVNNIMSNIVFALIEEAGVPTHFVEQLSDRETLVKAVKILPLEVIIRNVAAGSFSKRYGVEEGSPLLRSTLEFSLKEDELGDPLINDDHVLAIGIATEEEIAQVKEYAHKVNEIMSGFFIDRGLRLIDFKIEFGKTSDGQIILADEVSPDTCRLWDVKTNEKMDKDRFRRDLGKVEETYQAVLARVREAHT